MSIHPHLKQAYVLVNIFLLASWALLVTPSLAADITGQVISILDGDTIEALHNPALNASDSTASTAMRKVKPTASEPSKQPLS